MRSKSALLVLILLVSLSAFANPKDSLRLEQKDGHKYIVHRVVKSESLATLALKYGVDESQLLSSNPLISDKVYPGQLIKVPLNEQKYGEQRIAPVVAITDSRLPLAKTLPSPEPNSTMASAPAPSAPAKVEPPVIAIPASKEPDKKVEAKQDLPKPKTETEYKTYVVASPQTVQHLAESFMIPAKDIIELNKLKNYNLKEGQRIKIPLHPSNQQEATAVAVVPPPPAPIKETPKAEPIYGKPSYSPPVAKVEPKPEPKPEIKPEPKPEPKPVVASKPSPLPVVAAAPAPKPSAKPLPTIKAKEEPEVQELDNDSMMMLVMKKQRRNEELSKLDSEYIHPDRDSYRVFDYKRYAYNYDLYSMQTAEHNAIEVSTTNQRKGSGNKNTTHVVKRGETLPNIAKKYRVSATDIINWNGLLSYRVREGQELVINSDRANISPYQRTVADRNEVTAETGIKYEFVTGLAHYDSKTLARGVYVNNIEKGKFVYVINKDNYREDFARVMGPLPKGTPKDVIIILDQETAAELKVEKSWVNVEVYYGIIHELPTANK